MSKERDGVFTGNLQIVAVVGAIIWSLVTVPLAMPFLFATHLLVMGVGAGLMK